MEAYKSIMVLTPNGRRQNVKVTPNTTLLQVLEEVCTKHGFNSKEFDLKHHNKIMNVDNVIRFTGLPNNALLEMVAAVKVRQDTEVFLGVQIESGERFTGSFMPSESLWSVLCKLCPKEVSKDGNPVAVYMRTEVSGRASLDSTTLRSLGITGGRAIIRFVHRSPEELRVQANVSAPLSRPLSKHKIESVGGRSEEYESTDKPSSTSLTQQTEKTPKENNSKQIGKKENISPVNKSEEKELKDRSPLHNERISSSADQSMEVCKSEPMVEELIHSNKNEAKEDNKTKSFKGKETKTESNVPDEEEPMDVTDSKKCLSDDGKIGKLEPCSEDTSVTEAEEEISLLPGDRSGCVFSLDKPLCAEGKKLEKDLPDEFFEVTLEDARVLLRDLKRRRAELEDAPLLTSAIRRQREMDFLTMPCVLRIMFPDRLVLQGCFAGGEVVEDVKGFIRESLEDPECPFHLYLSPPKVILKPESFLYEVDGFPTTLVYFAYDRNESSDSSSHISGVTKKQYLRNDVLSNITSQISATKVACKSRGILSDSLNTRPSTGNALSKLTTDTTTQPSTSKGVASSELLDRGSGVPPNRPVTRTPVDQVPKWFRSAK